MSKKSLKQQLDGKPLKKAKPTNEKWVMPTVLIALAVLLILIIVIGGIWISRYTRAANQTVDTLGGLGSSSSSMDSGAGYGGTYGNGTGGTYQGTGAAGMLGASGDTAAAANFQFGEISGTTYYSPMSGVRFSAPSDWKLNGANSAQSGGAVLDLDAQDGAGTSSVKIEFYPLSSSGYSSSTEVLAALKGSITPTNSNLKANFGGNKFSGFAFTGTNNGSNAHAEILAADVNGYAMIIQIIAPKAGDVKTIQNMFS